MTQRRQGKTPAEQGGMTAAEVTEMRLRAKTIVDAQRRAAEQVKQGGN